jgi:hypothetical protein
MGMTAIGNQFWHSARPTRDTKCVWYVLVAAADCHSNALNNKTHLDFVTDRYIVFVST